MVEIYHLEDANYENRQRNHVGFQKYIEVIEFAKVNRKQSEPTQRTENEQRVKSLVQELDEIAKAFNDVIIDNFIRKSQNQYVRRHNTDGTIEQLIPELTPEPTKTEMPSIVAKQKAPSPTPKVNQVQQKLLSSQRRIQSSGPSRTRYVYKKKLDEQETNPSKSLDFNQKAVEKCPPLPSRAQTSLSPRRTPRQSQSKLTQKPSPGKSPSVSPQRTPRQSTSKLPQRPPPRKSPVVESVNIQKVKSMTSESPRRPVINKNDMKSVKQSLTQEHETMDITELLDVYNSIRSPNSVFQSLSVDNPSLKTKSEESSRRNFKFNYIKLNPLKGRKVSKKKRSQRRTLPSQLLNPYAIIQGIEPMNNRQGHSRSKAKSAINRAHLIPRY